MKVYKQTTKCPLDAHSIRVICVEAYVDPRTLARALNGHRVQPMTRVRVVVALERHGFGHLLPRTQADTVLLAGRDAAGEVS